ncbi:MAG: F510_1955 family glycosylhydrolase [Gammaproteobacteria bacterium]
MTRHRILTYLGLGIVALAAAVFLVSRSFSGGETTVAALAQDTHFHGIAVDPRDANRLYLATHHGVFTVGPDGRARRVSETEDDFMGFTPHPADPDVLYASGHPAGGGNLGFIVSRDGGRSWSKLAEGVGGPVDFHQMDVSKADPSVVYGIYGDLQKSTDGGRSWSRVGPAPEGIIGLAASSKEVDRIYAATQRGLMVSTDGGRRWQSAHEPRQAATMVHVTPDGTTYAFIASTGLIRAAEPDLDWTTLGDGFEGEYVLHLAAGGGGEQRILYAVTVNPETKAQALHVSHDGGRRWKLLGAANG